MAGLQFRTSNRNRPAGVFGKLFMSLFFGVFAAFGIGFVYLIGSDVFATAQTYAWEAAPCPVEKTQRGTFPRGCIRLNEF